MKRTQIHITLQQDAQLRQLADATGLPAAEHIRRAIDAYLRQQIPQTPRSLSDSPPTASPDAREPRADAAFGYT